MKLNAKNVALNVENVKITKITAKLAVMYQEVIPHNVTVQIIIMMTKIQEVA